jgi:hypothetical protein
MSTGLSNIRVMWVAILVSLVIAVVASVATFFARPSPANDGIVVSSPSLKYVPGLDHVKCKSLHGGHAPSTCDSLKFVIQVVQISDMSGQPAGCAAFFPYNSLTVHTSSLGESTTLTWQLPAASTAKLEGIAFINANGDNDPITGNDATPFGATPVASTVNGVQTLQLTLPPSTTSTSVFGHLPVVKWGGKKCLGGDPVISNSAD